MSRNCKSCEGAIYVEWRGGFCSRACQKLESVLRLRDKTYKAERGLAEQHETVDAGIDIEEIIPGPRARLIMEFRELRGLDGDL